MLHDSCFMRILFTGGGTGGHLFPIIAITREIKRLSGNENIAFSYIGPKDRMGDILLIQENFKIHHILPGKIRRYFSLKNITDALFNIPVSILQRDRKERMGDILLIQENFKIHHILPGKIRRYFSLKNITDALFNIPVSILQ